MNSALLVIDVQQGLFDTTPPPFEAMRVIERINDMTCRARALNIPVIFIQHQSSNGVLEKNTLGWQLAKGLCSLEEDHYLDKTTPDSFLRTGLNELLQAQQIEHLVLCGYASEFCVDTTARSAAAHGYAVCLAADAHTTHDKMHASAIQIRAHENATLPSIKSFGVPIVAEVSSKIFI